MLDFLKGVFSPMVDWIYSYFLVNVVIVPEATWDMRKGGVDFKEPISQSAALLVINISNHSINIHDAGVCLQKGKEMSLNFDLPIEVKPHDRTELILETNVFHKLAQNNFKDIKYFFVEDALFRRYKARLSKGDRERLLKTYYLRRVE